MYSEIKNNNQILINRCTEAEKILLEDIVDCITDTTVLSFTKLNGDTGDFEGVILNIEDEKAKNFTVNSELPNSLTINPNELVTITFDIEPNDLDKIYINSNDLENLVIVTLENNAITLYAKQAGNYTLGYVLTKSGYNAITNTIKISCIERTTTKIEFVAINKENVEFEVIDTNSTKYDTQSSTINSAIFDLPVGTYTVKIFDKESKSLLKTVEQKITEEMLEQPMHILEINNID